MTSQASDLKNVTSAKAESKNDDWGVVAQSRVSKNTINPIRAIVDKIAIPKSDTKQLIPLSIGDPTVFGNLDIPEIAVESIITQVKSKRYNGYAPSSGFPEARDAVAKKLSTTEAPLTRDDIIITSGCSGALAIAIPALADQGDNVLIPRPGFSLYQTICGHYSIEGRFYDLLPDQNWEIDLKSMGSLVDSKTKAILINNPSNPNGSNFSKQHLLEILAFAQKHKLPIISDEVYAGMVFKGQVFHPLATLSTEVPILTCGGVAKQFVMPGWRIGWIAVHDRKGRFKLIREACLSLSQLVLGANTVAQAVLPDLLLKTKPDFYEKVMGILEENAHAFVERISKIKGLRVKEPQGAMYLMVEIDTKQFKDIADDADFAQKLLKEELVFVLPGSCFQAKNFFRVVFCAPKETLAEAGERIEAFCKAHAA